MSSFPKAAPDRLKRRSGWDIISKKQRELFNLCEFCHQHGEGKKWYLRAENYSSDLLSDLRRRSYIHHFFETPERLGKNMSRLDSLNKMPGFIRDVVIAGLVRRQKKKHYGQVLPFEEIEKIFEFVNSVVRLPCICRHVTMGSEQRYCYGLSIDPGESNEMGRIIRSIGADYLTGPDVAGLEVLSKEKALEQLKGLEKDALIHTVWTFMSPFIGGICNCDYNCIAMRAVSKSYPVLFRAEYVAEVSVDLCNGCRACIKTCQFSAMSYSRSAEKVSINRLKCYGCGICRAACNKDAISLKDRADVPAAANLWGL